MPRSHRTLLIPRPGIILVHSRPTSPDFTDADLSKWYNKTHIPDVLATGRVSAAARFQLLSGAAIISQPGDDGHQQNEGEQPPLPYMAVYYLPDLGWLHEEGCEFWTLPLVVGDGRSVFEVGEFEMGFWEVVTTGRRDEGVQGTPRQVVLQYLDAEEVDGKDADVVLADSRQGLRGVAANVPVRSTLFKVDETHLSSPWVAADGGGDAMNLSNKNRYLCLHEIFDGGEVRTLSTQAKAIHYTLLGESEHGNRQAWEEAFA